MIYNIAIIGYGYWGNIILNTLIQLGYTNIILCDNTNINSTGFGFQTLNDYKDIIDYPCDKVFISTPATTHYEICKYFLKNKIDVFCEKPLTLDLSSTNHLYEIAKKNKADLFVDYLFIYSDAIQQLKKYITYDGLYGKPNLIHLNRLNKGPARKDVSALYDLTSHDISILSYLLETHPYICEHTEGKFLGGEQYDTCHSFLSYTNNIIATINTSWAYNTKIRTSYFNFDDTTFIWDDTTKTLTNKTMVYKDKSKPLEVAITKFLTNNYNKEEQEQVTKITAEVLQWK